MISCVPVLGGNSYGVTPEGSTSLATLGKLFPSRYCVQWSKSVGVNHEMINAHARGCCQNKSDRDVGYCLLGCVSL